MREAAIAAGLELKEALVVKADGPKQADSLLVILVGFDQAASLAHRRWCPLLTAQPADQRRLGQQAEVPLRSGQAVRDKVVGNPDHIAEGGPRAGPAQASRWQVIASTML